MNCAPLAPFLGLLMSPCSRLLRDARSALRPTPGTAWARSSIDPYQQFQAVRCSHRCWKTRTSVVGCPMRMRVRRRPWSTRSTPMNSTLMTQAALMCPFLLPLIAQPPTIKATKAFTANSSEVSPWGNSSIAEHRNCPEKIAIDRYARFLPRT